MFKMTNAWMHTISRDESIAKNARVNTCGRTPAADAHSTNAPITATIAGGFSNETLSMRKEIGRLMFSTSASPSSSPTPPSLSLVVLLLDDVVGSGVEGVAALLLVVVAAVALVALVVLLLLVAVLELQLLLEVVVLLFGTKPPNAHFTLVVAIADCK